MAHEVCVPLLPCRDIDEIAAFYGVLGFRATYRRPPPAPYLALRRDDIQLHFFAVPELEPDTSYGSCLIQVDDIGALHRAFADRMRAAYGQVLTTGLPRMTRPRVRRAGDGLTGFSIVDPGGNWIRVIAKVEGAPGSASRLGRALENAVVLAEVRGDPVLAAETLDRALAVAAPPDDPADMAEALVYRAELALILADPRTAEAALQRARELDATGEELAELAEALAARCAVEAEQA